MPDEKIHVEEKGHSFFSRIGLENFKAFGERQGVLFRPITLLYGKNSSGKSSFIQSLLFLQELSRGSLSPDVHEIKRHSLTLGGFDRFIHKRQGGILAFELSLDLEDDLGKVTIRLEIQRSGHQRAVILDRIFIRDSKKDDNLVSLKYKNDGRYELEFGEDCPFVSNENISELKGFFLCVVTENNLIPDRVVTNREKEQTDVSRDARLKLENFLQKVSRLLLNFLDRMSYLCGNRDVAEQGVLDGAGTGLQGGQAGGLQYWEELRKDNLLRNRVNQYLGLLFEDRYQIVEERFFSSSIAAKIAANMQEDFGGILDDDLESGDDIPGGGDFYDEEPSDRSSMENSKGGQRSFQDIVQDELDKDVTQSQRNEIRILDNLTGLRMLPNELGFGIGQVIPIVAAACLPGRTVIVEQPETHLHPKQQADLGEILASSMALQEGGGEGSTFIIETHSIHILERLGKIIRETSKGRDFKGLRLKSEEVGVYYVDAEESSSVKLRRMELRDDGKLKRKWPGEFFNEDMNDLF